jgi:myotubularin-related protein 3/4
MEEVKSEGILEEDKTLKGGSASPASISVPCVLVPGECVSFLGSTRDGNSILLTNYRLHVTLSAKICEDLGNFINVPLSCIEATEARDLFFIHIMCKDSRYYRVSFGDNATCEDWQRRLTTAIHPPANIEDSFAFVHYRWALEAQFEELEEEDGTHHLANNDCDTFRHEVSRLGFDLSGSWRISAVNKDFKLCPTYPPEILVPACISDQVLEKVGSFRSARRVPAVVWRHPHTGAVLARCSQPEVGWLGWRSAEDEDLVRAVADASAYDQPNMQSLPSDLNGSEGDRSDAIVVSGVEGVPSLKDLSAEVAVAAANNAKVLIVDARSYPAAVGNRARGGGVECIEYYPFAEIIFMSLGNIHNIRKSFQALRGLCNQTPADAFSGGSGWLAALDATKWLYHASGLLKAATRVATALHSEGRPGTL